MADWLTYLFLGVLLIVIGVLNMMGNISSLHSYHRHRVREEDKKQFGKIVGIGTITIGCSLILFGTLTQLHHLWSVGMICGFILGLGIIFYAMFKYNKGIF